MPKVRMYIMTKEGKIMYFDVTKFNSEYEMYTELWKLLYGIEFNELCLQIL